MKTIPKKIKRKDRSVELLEDIDDKLNILMVKGVFQKKLDKDRPIKRFWDKEKKYVQFVIFVVKLYIIASVGWSTLDIMDLFLTFV